MSDPFPLPTRPSRLAPEGTRGDRINHLLDRLPPAELSALAGSLTREAHARGVWIEADGVRRDLPFALRPRVLDLRRRGYVHHVAWQLRMGLRRLSRVLRDDPRAREVLPLEPLERPWIEAYGRPNGAGGPAERIFCRLDAVAAFDAPDGAPFLHFVEPNVVGVGGLRYIAAAEALLLERLVPRLGRMDDELAFDGNADPRVLLWEELVEHARDLGIERPPVVAFVDDKSLYRLGGEFAQIVPWYRSRGLEAVYADVRELEALPGGRVACGGREVDVVYRYLELRELAELETGGADLSGMRAAFAGGRVVPTAGGDLEHKSAFELLTDPAYRGHFTDEMARVFDRHVLWTRLLHDRRTTGPDGAPVDLAAYVWRSRRGLVLKPNRASGGEGVVIGPAVSESAWQAAVARAFARPRSHVVQQHVQTPTELLPVLGEDGQVRFDPWHTTAGFYPGRRGLGVLGRMARGPVVNVHSGGGVAAFLVGVA